MKQPKNILMIHCDQLRADCLGYAGNPDVRTPNLDRLAADSVNYTQHYTVYPICTPSRYSMWTGMYVHQNCAWNNGASLPAGFETIPGILRQHGWQTSVVGKMHFTPHHQNIGFDTMHLAEHYDDTIDDEYHYELSRMGLLDRVDLHYSKSRYSFPMEEPFKSWLKCNPTTLPKEMHQTGWCTGKALEEIGAWDGGSHLLAVGYIRPHLPMDPPKPYDTMYDPAKLTLPPDYTPEALEIDCAFQPGKHSYRELSEADIRQSMAYYYGNISFIDEGVGQIISLLKEKGLYEDTMIIFTSDHGDYMGQHHMTAKCNHMYDSLARIPLLVKYPGGPRGRDERLCENIDLMPTVLEVCGYDRPATVQGLSLLSDQEKEYVFAEGQYGNDREPCVGYMIRTEDYKLLLRGTLADGMLFDLKKDPYELVNRFHDPDYAQVLREMELRLIDKMLFTGTGKLHCDRSAVQSVPAEILQRNYEVTRSFIRGCWEREQGAKRAEKTDS